MNPRKNRKSQKTKTTLMVDDNPESTDDKYFTEPADPNELKKMLKNKKKTTSCTSVSGGNKSDILKKSERRITAKLLAFEERTEEKFAAFGA